MDLPPDLQAPVPVKHECVIRAAAYYAVPPELLIAIREQEGGAPGMMSPNQNGSFDLGPMQINTVHLKTFAEHNISGEQIRDDECTNMYAGAFILHREIMGASGDLWRAVGNYHSKTPRFHYRYRDSVARRYTRMQRDFAPYMTWLRNSAAIMRVKMMEANGDMRVASLTVNGVQSGNSDSR